MESAVETNIEKAQKRQKLYYDQKHGAGDLFFMGALVSKKDFISKKCKEGKMDYRWQGPFIVTKVLGKGLYTAGDSQEGRVASSCSKKRGDGELYLWGRQTTQHGSMNGCAMCHEWFHELCAQLQVDSDPNQEATDGIVLHVRIS